MSTRTLFTIAAVVVLGLICFAQSEEGAGQSEPTRVVPAQGEAPTRQQLIRKQIEAIAAARLQHQREPGDEAAPEQPRASHRVQVLLLDIAENADHPRLAELRRLAQSGKAAPGIIALADELIELKAATTSMNVSMVVVSGESSQLRNEQEVPFVAKSQTSGGSQIVSQGGIATAGYRLECRSESQSMQHARLEMSIESSRLTPTNESELTMMQKWRFNWFGVWSGTPGSEAILVAETPRASGNAGKDRAPERYLLMRVDAVE